MNSRARRSFTLGAALLASWSALLFSGCETFNRVRGEFHATLPAEVAAATRATTAAVRELELAEITNRADALTARFDMRNARGDRITIVLAHVAGGVTDVRIQVGTLGDPVLSQTIFETIKRHL